ncbi:conserved hypothetical protein [Escherichia coli ED1a]|uniref:Uncharacterized protein n=1 Tax=Escherichia coli O81 (strain ED1a) TaxID=585397 RepID=B7N215_ECO81|nr:conserved hypothetical protein [Escherichia coli ED1a]
MYRPSGSISLKVRFCCWQYGWTPQPNAVLDFDKNSLKAGNVLPVLSFCMIQQEKNHVY